MRLDGQPRIHAKILGMARSSERSQSDRPVKPAGDPGPNPIWFKPIMFGFMLLGLIWIIVFYVSNQELPVQAWGSGNILAGFGIMFIGFLMTTRWR